MGTDSNSFWTDARTTFAKRSNLFRIEFDLGGGSSRLDKNLFEKVSGVQYVAKSVNLPSFTIGQAEMDRNGIGGESAELVTGYLDWQPVTLTFADFIFDREMTAILRKDDTDQVKRGIKQRKESYKSTFATPGTDYTSLYQVLVYAFSRAFGSDVYQSSTTFDKKRFRRFFRSINIVSLDDSLNPIEKWTLKHIWPVDFTNADLSYENDGIREFSITLDYIVAEYTAYKTGGSEVLFTRFKSRGNPDDLDDQMYGGVIE